MTAATDGYSQMIKRDSTNATGGAPGFVNTALTVNTVAGQAVTAFEWALLAKMDNYADAGENVALYAQANKHGKGPTWGACIEATDTTPGDTTALVGVEVDCWTSGADNGSVIGVEVAVGDAVAIRGGTKGVAQGTCGVRVGASMATPWAKWSIGYSAVDFTYTGLHLRSNAPRAIHLEGEYVVGLDVSNAKCQSAIRMKAGQRITFDAYDYTGMQFDNGRFKFTSGTTEIFSIDMTTGDLYKRGVKVL